MKKPLNLNTKTIMWWDLEVNIWMVRKRLKPKTKVPASVMKYFFERECFK